MYSTRQTPFYRLEMNGPFPTLYPCLQGKSLAKAIVSRDRRPCTSPRSSLLEYTGGSKDQRIVVVGTDYL